MPRHSDRHRGMRRSTDLPEVLRTRRSGASFLSARVDGNSRGGPAIRPSRARSHRGTALPSARWIVSVWRLELVRGPPVYLHASGFERLLRRQSSLAWTKQAHWVTGRVRTAALAALGSRIAPSDSASSTACVAIPEPDAHMRLQLMRVVAPARRHVRRSVLERDLHTPPLPLRHARPVRDAVIDAFDHDKFR
jgi:hypothetical protein